MELWLLCTALPLNILDHCMKLYWIPTVSVQVMLRKKESNGKVIKGNNSVISQDGVMVLVHCTSPYCGWPLYELTCFEFQPVVFKLCSGQGKVTKGSNTVISQDGVMVLVHCTFSQCAWPLYEVILNSNHKSSSYGPDKRKQWKSNKGQ
jgi:hypothetical protein